MLLDVGCGNHKKGDIGLDILLNSDCDIIGDAHNIPFRDKVFKKCICTEVLEHVYCPLRVIKEMKRITKKSLLITIPNIMNFKSIKRWILEGRLSGSHEHIYGWTLREFSHLLNSVGLNEMSFEFITFPHYHNVSRWSRFIPHIFNKSLVVNVRLQTKKNYWEKRYAKGGLSSPKNRENDKNWKNMMIKKHGPINGKVIDVGCGDLVYWDKLPEDYVGIDISKIIIDKNIRKYPDRTFIHELAETRISHLKASWVFCLHVLYHIMDDKAYVKILENLCHYSTNKIFILTWRKNPFSNKTTDGKYQKFRRFEDHIPLLEKHGFSLIDYQPSPYDIGGMYVFSCDKSLVVKVKLYDDC